MEPQSPSTRLTPAALGGISLLLVMALAASGGWGGVELLGKARPGTGPHTRLLHVELAAPIVRTSQRVNRRLEERPPLAAVARTNRRAKAAPVLVLPSTLNCARPVCQVAERLLSLPPPAILA